jgi:hypothetical protein
VGELQSLSADTAPVRFSKWRQTLEQLNPRPMQVIRVRSIEAVRETLRGPGIEILRVNVEPAANGFESNRAPAAKRVRDSEALAKFLDRCVKDRAGNRVRPAGPPPVEGNDWRMRFPVSLLSCNESVQCEPIDVVYQCHETYGRQLLSSLSGESLNQPWRPVKMAGIARQAREIWADVS